MRGIDWVDVLLHAVGAFAFMMAMSFAACYVGSVVILIIGVLLNTLFWVIRETIQDINKGHRFPFVWPIRRSTQKDLEGAVPVIVGVIVAFGSVGCIGG